MGTIAITGSASGIGAATAARLRESGHEIIGIDRAGADIDADLGIAGGSARRHRGHHGRAPTPSTGRCCAPASARSRSDPAR